jgi:hypothetical protein
MQNFMCLQFTPQLLKTLDFFLLLSPSVESGLRIGSDIKWFQSLSDHSCGRINHDPSYQVQRQAPLNQLSIG